MIRFDRTPGQTQVLPGTVSANGFIFTSGLVAPAVFAAIEAGGGEVPALDQITGTVEVLRSTLAGAGVGVEDVVKVNAWLSSDALIPAWFEAWQSVWPERGPARTTLIAGFFDPRVHIEIEAVAARP